MKKIWWLALLIFSVNGAQAFATVNTFSCTDSDNGSFATPVPGKTHFWWEKNGERVFDRTFTDVYSSSRNQYVSFYCRNNIIKYQLFDCGLPAVAPLCQGQQQTSSVEVVVTHKSVETEPILLEGADYQFITHYELSAPNGATTLKGLYFVNNLDEKENNISSLEAEAAKEYLYVLMGPDRELVTGATTDDGKLYFDLSSQPVTISDGAVNIGVAAKPKIDPAKAENTSIRFVLNRALGAKGFDLIEASTKQVLAYDQVKMSNNDKPGTFTRARSGLKIAHFNPQSPLFEPSISAQPIYRLQVENLSSSQRAELKRGSLDLRAIGMEKQNGALLQASDFTIRELNTDLQPIGNAPATLSLIDDSRNNASSASLSLNFNNFQLSPSQVRILEIQIANLVDDANGKGDDDGSAVQLRPAVVNDGGTFGLEELSKANWVWSDLSDSLKNGQRTDWRSGVNLSMTGGAIVVYD